MDANSIVNKFLRANFIPRLASALVLVPFVLYIFFLGGVVYRTFIALIACLMLWEWHKIITHRHLSLAQYTKWYIAGLIYVLLPTYSLMNLRFLPYGVEILLWLVVTVWAADTASYLFGIAFGGKKLCPSISPNKTWAGFGGGLLMSALVSYIFSCYYEGRVDHLVKYFFLGAIIAFIGQIGDLSESAIKRYFGVKDSSNIIPGHGGILDRLDALLPNSVLVYLLCSYGLL